MRRDPATLDVLIDKAQFMHVKGFNCAETVLWAMSSYWNIDMSTACVTGLGGGIARTGATCGALLGAIVALGVKVGRTEPRDDEKKTLCYRLGQEVISGFNRHMGTTVCRDMIGFVLGEEGGAKRYAEGGFKDGICKDAIIAAVRAGIEAGDSMPEPERE